METGITNHFKFLCCGILLLFLGFPVQGNVYLEADTEYSAFRDVSFVEAVKEISQRFNVFFTFDLELVEGITVDEAFRDIDDVENAVEYVLYETDLNYRIIDTRYVIIYKNDQEGINSLKEMSRHLDGLIHEGERRIPVSAKRGARMVSRLPMSLGSKSINHIAFTVNGTVTDQDGEPLIGVNIQVKDSSKGTATDFDGRFTLEDIDENAVLVISYVGYQTQEVAVAGKSDLEIAMISDSQLLDEVVVVGYGTQSKRNVAGSQSGISPDDFNREPVSDVQEALQGKISGVRMERTNAQPGAGFKMRIRGVNSINGSNDALIVVNGVQGANMSNIDPEDIESIEVLKDASATAIYGSRGANGVVLITTKKGTSEKPTIDFKSSLGFQTVTNRLDLLNAADFARTINASRIDVGANPPISEEEVARYEREGGTDWQDVIFQNAAPVQNYNISLNKGDSDGLSYYLSGNYVRNNGTVYDQKYERFGIMSNIDFRYSEKLNFNLNINGAQKRRFGHGVAEIGRAVKMSPLSPHYLDENGSLMLQGEYAAITLNPYIQARLTEVNNMGTEINISGTAKYQISDVLSLDLFVAAIKGNTDNKNYRDKAYDDKGNGQIVNTGIFDFQNTNRLTYENDLNTNNYLKADVIVEQRYFNYGSTTINANNFITDATGYKDISLANTLESSQNFYNEKLLSFLGRVHYMYKDKYILTVSGREDASSKFRKGNRFGFFPSAAIGWKMDEERFMKDSRIIDQFKWRVSYGETGSQAIAALATRARLQSGSGVGWDIDDIGEKEIGIAPTSTLNNPFLTWETTSQKNFGVDLVMFNSRFTFTADVYDKKTRDLLLDVQLPVYTGATKIVQNIGKMENKGLELSLGGKPVSKKDWFVDLNFNLSFNRNKILELSGEDEMETGGRPSQTGGVAPTILKVGHPISSFRGYVFEGVYQLDEKEEAANYGKQPGDAKYRDINNDGTISGEDITIIGSPFPDFYYGFNGTISYKNFDLNVMIQGSQGGKIYNIVAAELFGLGGSSLDPVTSEILNRWSPENPSNTVPAFTKTSSTEVASTQFVQDASWIRAKNLSLSYRFTPENLESLQINSLRIYISAQNFWSKYSDEFMGYDPALQSSTADNSMGIFGNFGAYPMPRIITFGLNLNF